MQLKKKAGINQKSLAFFVVALLKVSWFFGLFNDDFSALQVIWGGSQKLWECMCKQRFIL